MVDPQPVEAAFVNQSKDEHMRRLEDLGALHANGRERIDVEEASKVDLFRSHAPEGEPVALIAQQLVEGVDASGHTGLAVQLFQL